MALAALFVVDFVPNYAQYQLSPMAIQIMETFGIDKVAYSALFAAPMILGVPLAFASGILLGRHNPRNVVLGALCISTLGSLIVLLAPSYLPLFLGFTLEGCCLSFVVPTCVIVATKDLGARGVTWGVGLMFAAASLSQALATATTRLLPGLLEAREISFGLFVLATLTFLILFRVPVDVRSRGREEDKKPAESPLSTVGQLLRGRDYRMLCVCLFLNMGIFVLVASLVPTALSEIGVDAVHAGAFASFFTLGNLLGCFVVPALAGRVLGMRSLVALLAVLGALLVNVVPAGPALIACIALAGLFVGGLKPLLVSLSARAKAARGGREAMASALAAMMQALGAIVLPTYVILPLVGGALDSAYLLGGICLLVCAALAYWLPE